MTTPPQGPGRTGRADLPRRGARAAAPPIPTDFAELERRAASGHVAARLGLRRGRRRRGRDDAANRAAFERWQIVPRMLHGDASATCPPSCSAAGCAHPCCWRRSGRRAWSAATATCRSRAARRPSPACPTSSPTRAARRWRTCRGDGRRAALVPALLVHRRAPRRQPDRRAPTASGAEALVVTLDTTMLGWRPQDLNLGSLPFAQGIGIAQYTSRPAVPARSSASGSPPGGPGGRGRQGRVEVTARRAPVAAVDQPRAPRRPPRQPPLPDAARGRRDVPRHLLQPRAHLGRTSATLRDRTDLPFLLKGILHPDDARRAVEVGASGLAAAGLSLLWGRTLMTNPFALSFTELPAKLKRYRRKRNCIGQRLHRRRSRTMANATRKRPWTGIVDAARNVKILTVETFVGDDLDAETGQSLVVVHRRGQIDGSR